MLDVPPGLRLPSPLVELRDERLDRRGVRVWLKRDDLIHPELHGNKWRKLRDNLAAAREQGHDTLLTFGGAYSHHIRATAAAGHYLGLSTVGIIRGEEQRPLNPTLAYATDRGMRLSYLDRTTYRHKTDPAVIGRLSDQFGRFYLLPEGGSNELAVRGCAELPAEITEPFDIVCVSVGTGATLAGLSAGLGSGQRAIGFAALKGADFLAEDVADLQRRTYGRVIDNWHVETGYHFGGYAKRNSELDGFVESFAAVQRIRLDWVYVAKMLYGVFDLIRIGRIGTGARVVAVITGRG